jgi:hypothetical protein
MDIRTNEMPPPCESKDYFFDGTKVTVFSVIGSGYLIIYTHDTKLVFTGR